MGCETQNTPADETSSAGVHPWALTSMSVLWTLAALSRSAPPKFNRGELCRLPLGLPPPRWPPPASRGRPPLGGRPPRRWPRGGPRGGRLGALALGHPVHRPRLLHLLARADRIAFLQQAAVNAARVLSAIWS